MIFGMNTEHELHCNTNYIGRQYVWLKDTDSTNEVIKRLLKDEATIESIGQDLRELIEGDPADGLVVISDHQTAGKGRSGRTWTDETGASVAMSVMIRPRIEVDDCSKVTLVSALAVVKAIKEVCDMDAGIKWPNDVVIDGRKVCGILTELELSAEEPSLIIGIGLNVNQADMPDELMDRAISLYMASGCDTVYDREELIEAILENLEHYYDVFSKSADMSLLKDEYDSCLVNIGRTVRTTDPKEPIEGTAKGIDDEGRLLIETVDGVIHPVYAGEVSVRGIYGYV